MITFWKRKDITLGEQSVSELTILEWKKYFSIKLFHFKSTDGVQDRFHTHAFNSLSILLHGDYIEEVIDGGSWKVNKLKRSRKRFLYIPANEFHRITRSNGCRTLLITGPWGDQFKELRHFDAEVWREHHCGLHRKDLRVGNFRVPHFF